ncbi:hypothetical protein PMAC_001058 [Pneumocystis sp. 'macacae']|nr:hypothetical protein PMAC_001058 [Pneumocystis sp. 'macacae']
MWEERVREVCTQELRGGRRADQGIMRRCLRGICVDFDEIWRRKEWNKRFFPACQGQRDECVHEVGRGERGRHLKMCTVLIRVEEYKKKTKEVEVELSADQT